MNHVKRFWTQLTIDNWINEVSGWIVESIDGEYVNITAHSLLVGRTYIKLPGELKNSKKRID